MMLKYLLRNACLTKNFQVNLPFLSELFDNPVREMTERMAGKMCNVFHSESGCESV